MVSDLENKKINSEEDTRGASLVEYLLLAALIAAVCIAAVRLLGRNTSTNYYQAASAVGAA